MTISPAIKLTALGVCFIAGSLTTLNDVPTLAPAVSITASPVPVTVFSPEPYRVQRSVSDDFDNLIMSAPTCWEDEVVVLVIHDPYGDLDLNNVVGCVPADNLPITGYRP